MAPLFKLKQKLKGYKMKTIHFSQLAELNSQTHAAFTCLKIADTSEQGINDLKAEANAFFEEIGVFKDGVAVSDILYITGNVLGDEGRHDYVFELTNGSTANIPPQARIHEMPDLKWLDDFIVNYEKDYFLEE